MYFNKKHLDINYSRFVNDDFNTHEGSCIKHQITECADIHQEYGGFPDSYSYDNTRINQLWYDNTQIDYEDLGKQLGMEVISVSAIRQRPGCVIPLHRDMFYQITSKYPNDTRLKVRANVHLEDWKMGHFIQYGDTVFTHWKAGDALMWDSEVWHLGANAGFQDKFTLQVSGFLLDDNS